MKRVKLLFAALIVIAGVSNALAKSNSANIDYVYVFTDTDYEFVGNSYNSSTQCLTSGSTACVHIITLPDNQPAPPSQLDDSQTTYTFTDGGPTPGRWTAITNDGQ